RPARSAWQQSGGGSGLNAARQGSVGVDATGSAVCAFMWHGTRPSGRTKERERLMGSRIAARVLFVGVVLFVTSTRADVSGSFDGSVTSKARADAVAISAALSITGRTVAGTVALPSDLPVIGGAYLVHGVATRKRVNVSGTGATGGRFTWKAKIAGDTLRGKMRVKGPGAKLAGTLTMNRNVSTTDGSGCDAVFT